MSRNLCFRFLAGGSVLLVSSSLHFSRLKVLYLAVQTLRESGHEHVYDAIQLLLQLTQTSALLEIIHGLVDWLQVVFDVGYLVEFPSDSESHTCDLPGDQLVHHRDSSGGRYPNSTFSELQPRKIALGLITAKTCF
ncbi:hypothetical protein F2P56_011158 [Juglans regia]|uniref:Uncharacterized protein n=1 Tax=Juglans regia TaxID=51240 RepID=A0A833XSZ4_JUGRE|nr:hypothetical protein F2P56_011158 [Juglans regia]